MDGEQKLWDLQRQWLGRAVEILDLFHALERIREVSKIVHPGDKSRRETWVSDQLEDLLTGKVETVIRRWRGLAHPASEGRRWTADQQKTVTSAIRYFKNNRHRMHYDEYLAKSYPGGIRTRSSSDHFQSARSSICSPIQMARFRSISTLPAFNSRASSIFQAPC